MATFRGMKDLAAAGLSDKDIKNMAAAWLSCPAGDSIDIETFTILAGYSNTTNARKRFGEVKKRARTIVFGAGGAPASKKPMKKSNGTSTSNPSTKRKAATSTEIELEASAEKRSKSEDCDLKEETTEELN